MNAENFAYWMQGALELGTLKELNTEQVKIVQDHLNLVFKKVTPQYQITQSPFTTLPHFPPTNIGDGSTLIASC
jgi:hypothetical protein